MAERAQETPVVGPYVLHNVLGKGQTGVVKLGIHSVTKKKVAVKIIDRKKLEQHILAKVEREIAIMKLINHPNILGLYDVYENKRNLYLILEYVGGGELFDYLVKKKRLQMPEARKFFRQIVSAVNFCHQHLVCHRDLKPENLLLDSKKNVRIADFGMASVQLSDCMLETSCGSPHYAAPEVVRGIPYDGRKADVWSCGVILYALIVGCLPFDDDNFIHLLAKVKKGAFSIPGFVAADCRDLLTQMIKLDPEERLTMSQVRRHRFFKSEELSQEPPVQQVVELSDCMLETSCGSPHYAAPEVVRGIPYDGRKADVWSCGVILYALIVGCLPFDDDNFIHLLAKVKKGAFSIPGFVAADCRDLLTQMIKLDPEERLTMSQVRRHRFFKSEELSQEPPVQQVVETHNLHDESELDSDILNSMASLGCFKNRSDLIEKLLSEENTLERVMYFLLMDRKNKVSFRGEDTPTNQNIFNFQELDPPRKRSEHRTCKDDSESIKPIKPIIIKKRAMTYHGNTSDSIVPNAAHTHIDHHHPHSNNNTSISPPGSPWRSRLTAIKKSAGIFTRRRSQSSDETGRLDSNRRAGSSPDIAVRRSWFTNLLFHAPGQILPVVLKIRRRSLEETKQELENTFSSVPKMSHCPISQQEFHIVYKKSKGIYHRKTKINLRFEISSCKETPDEDSSIVIEIKFVDGSHRKFRKFCQILDAKLHRQDVIDYHLNGRDRHNGRGSQNSRGSRNSRGSQIGESSQNGTLSDGYLSSGTSLDEDSRSNEFNFSAHSTENLLDTDDSAEFH